MASPKHKILQLLQLLTQNRLGITKRDIGRKLDLTIRSVERYLDQLRGAGFPVAHDGKEDGGVALRYRLDRGDFKGLPQEIPPLGLSFEEAFTIIAALESASLPHCDWLDEARKTAIQKLALYLPNGEGRKIPMLRSGVLAVGPDEARLQNFSRGALKDLMEGAISRRVVEVAYPWSYLAKETGVKAEKKRYRKANPLGILLAHGGIYCVATLHPHRDARRLNVAKISGTRLLEEEFEPPTGFDLRKIRETGFYLWDELPQRVEIRFSPEASPAIRQRKIHSTQRIEELPDGGLILKLRVGGKMELIWWLLKWGANAEMIRPVSWLKEMKALVQAMANIYNAQPK